MQRKDDMNRIAYMVIKSLPFVPAWFYRVCRLGRDQDPHTEQERYDYLRKLVKRVNKSGRVSMAATTFLPRTALSCSRITRASLTFLL